MDRSNQNGKGLSAAPPNAAAERPLPFWVDLSIYASLPLFHVHTFMALTIVLLCLLGFQLLAPIQRIVDLVREEGSVGMRSVISEPSRSAERRVGKECRSR